MCFFKKKALKPTPGLVYEGNEKGYRCSGIKNFTGKEIVLAETEQGKPVYGNFIGAKFQAPNLVKCHLPKTIKEWYPIRDCPNFKEYSIDKDNPRYAVVNGVLVSKDLTELIDVPCGISGRFVLPQMEKLLFPICSPFGGCDKITELDFSSMKEQQEGLFLGKYCEGMTSLKRIILPLWAKDRPWAGPAFGDFANLVEYK